jgi:hypothetical protein
VTFSIFSCFLHIQPAVLQARDKAVILSEALRESIANRELYGAESKAPAMLVGRCSWELSGRKLQRKIKKSQTRGKPRDLQFCGPSLEKLNWQLFRANRKPAGSIHKRGWRHQLVTDQCATDLQR